MIVITVQKYKIATANLVSARFCRVLVRCYSLLASNLSVLLSVLRKLRSTQQTNKKKKIINQLILVRPVMPTVIAIAKIVRTIIFVLVSSLMNLVIQKLTSSVIQDSTASLKRGLVKNWFLKISDAVETLNAISITFVISSKRSVSLILV